MRYEVREIGPTQAKVYLENNYENNRQVSQAHVNELAAVMQRGDFMSLNGQNIILIDISGTLYDGQHRMLGIVKSGVTLPFLFAIADTEDEAIAAYLTIDSGMGRRTSAFIDGNQKNDAAAASKRLYALEYGSAPLLTTLMGRSESLTKVDRIATVSYYNENKAEITKLVQDARSIRRRIGCGSTSVYGFFIGLVKYLERDDELEEFIEDIRSLTPKSRTVSAYIRMITKTYMSGNKPTNKWQLGALLDAYEHYRQKDGSVMLNKNKIRLAEYNELLQEVRKHRSDKSGDAA